MSKDSLHDLSNRVSALRKEVREFLGGVTWKPVSKQFGLYTMNVPEREAFLSYAEHHFVELEKLLIAFAESEETLP